VNGVLKDIPDRNSILAGALHTNVFTVVFKQQLFESNGIAVEGREPFLVIMWHDRFAGNGCGDEKGFVNIDAAADGICKLPAGSPFRNGREAVTEPPHNKHRSI